MKTAQEWMSQMSGLDEPALLTVNRMAIREIQLDAFKAGAEWAAKICDGHADWMPAGNEECKDAILSAASNLKELPKL